MGVPGNISSQQQHCVFEQIAMLLPDQI